jgi:hypothetical protein
VTRRCLCSRNLVNEEAIARAGLQSQEKKVNKYYTNTNFPRIKDNKINIKKSLQEKRKLYVRNVNRDSSSRGPLLRNSGSTRRFAVRCHCYEQ